MYNKYVPVISGRWDENFDWMECGEWINAPNVYAKNVQKKKSVAAQSVLPLVTLFLCMTVIGISLQKRRNNV